MPKLISKIIPGGPKRAFHPFVPAMFHRIENEKSGSRLPVQALRSEANGFQYMKLYERIEPLGPGSLQWLDQPLPGTNGRGRSIFFTNHALRVWYYEDTSPTPIKTTDDRKPDDIMGEVLAKYERLTFSK